MRFGLSLGFGLTLAAIAEALEMGNASLAGGLYAARPVTPTVGMIWASTDRLYVSVCISAGVWVDLDSDAGATGAALLATATPAAAQGVLGVSSDTPLPAGAAVHHWRCDGAGADFSDIGSSPVDLVHMAGTREYQRPGLYRTLSATQQTADVVTNRMQATIGAIAGGGDFTLGVTVAAEGGNRCADLLSGVHCVAAVRLGASGIFGDAVYILVNGTSVCLRPFVAGGNYAEGALFQLDWSHPHRIDATWVQSTYTLSLWVDGRLLEARVLGASPACGPIDTVCLGGNEIAGIGLSNSSFVCADLTVHDTALSAAAILARADAVTRLY